MTTKFFTNEGTNTLLKKFEGIFTHNTDIEAFDALVGYLRASGYFAVRPFLENVPNIRILVGINVDSIVADFQQRGLLFLADAKKTLNEFIADLFKDIQNAQYSQQIENGIIQFVQDNISNKLEIRAHPTRKLHAKIYIFLPEGFSEHKPGAVITGSSNLTDAGLGTDEVKRNYEFNVLTHDYEDICFAEQEFEKLWDEGIPVLPADIKDLQTKSYLNDEYTPFEVYLKFLIEYFGKSVDFDPNAISDLPAGYKRLSYQIDAVSQGYELLRKHNGFFLADVVGLGKTVIAALIAKKFFFHNGFPTHISKILVIVPPSLKEGWHTTLDEFGIKTADIITNGSLHKIRRPGQYDLVIVDEAHKFRNDTASAYNDLQRICKTPTKNRLPDGSFAPKKVLLVSATPLNNRPDDIRNLILLFQDGKNSTLEVANLQHFFSQRKKEYDNARKESDPLIAQQIVKKTYELIRTKIVADITIRRTRTDLQNSEQYRKDLTEQGIIFPAVKRPVKILYQLDEDLEQLYDKTIMILSDPAKGLTYNRYQAIAFLNPDKKSRYLNADQISLQLARIMKTLLVKRIDSSFDAFKNSLKRFYNATNAMVKMFDNGRVYIAPNLSVSDYIIEDREDELIDILDIARETDPTIEICTPGDFQSGFFDGLKKDLSLLDDLCTAWDNVHNDPKLDEFILRLRNELFSGTINYSKKLVVFSESKETTLYLKNELEKNGFNRILTVHSGNRKERMEQVRRNFDANWPLAEQTDDCSILITTEVLAEGINLHRANVIVNYDTPWNATRLMQRIGRVNRIGTKASAIHIFNFYPTARVDNDIELRKKALMKLQAFHSALGEDSQIYSTDEEFNTFGLFDHDVEEERDERLAYLMELRKYKQENPESFRKIKNMPLRARCGRKDTTKTESTIVFIRNNRRDAFYFVTKDTACDEMSFIETAREFSANAPEKPQPLHENHHAQVNAALSDFREKLDIEAAHATVVDSVQGPNERKALMFLDAFTKMAIASDDEITLILAAKKAIKAGKFQQLQREINKLQRSQTRTKNSPSSLLEKLMSIITAYPLDADGNGDSLPLIPGRLKSDLQPEIIISESFCGGTKS